MSAGPLDDDDVTPSAQYQVEQSIVTKPEVTDPGSKSVIEAIDRIQLQRWPTPSDQNRSYRHMQAVEDSSAEEAGDRCCPTLDQHPPNPKMPKGPKDLSWIDSASVGSG